MTSTATSWATRVSTVPTILRHGLRLTCLSPDPRVSNWFFVDSPLQPLSVLFIYFIVVGFGQQAMSSRTAFRLNTFLNVYNGLQVLASAYIFKEVGTAATDQPLRPSSNLISFNRFWQAPFLADTASSANPLTTPKAPTLCGYADSLAVHCNVHLTLRFKMARALHLYYLTKVVDLLDTVRVTSELLWH